MPPPSLFHCSSPGVTPRGVWPGRWAYSTVPTPCSSQCGSFLPWLRDPQSTWWFLQSRKQSQVFLLQQRKPRQGPYRPPAPRPRLRLLLLTLQLVWGGDLQLFPAFLPRQPAEAQEFLSHARLCFARPGRAPSSEADLDFLKDMDLPCC